MKEYPSKKKEYTKLYNKYYTEKNTFTPLISGSPEYGEEYYKFHKREIKYYNYCKKNNIPYKKKGRPPHWRVERQPECLKIKKGKFLITF